MIKRTVRAAVRAALRHDRLRRLVTAELANTGRPAPAPARSREAGVFVDRHGAAHPLDPTLRDRLKPGWRSMLDPVAAAEPPTDEALRARVTKAEKVVREASSLCLTMAGAALDGRILEIGCYDGAAAFQLARLGARHVTGSDLARYYVTQRAGEPDARAIDAQQVALAELRTRARALAGVGIDRVDFVEDDITSSTLEPASLDGIVSFEVLEHLLRPAEAFASMRRLLNPGGVGYHDYNPFFSRIGGHSLCTLDFPWGHARLDDGDVERYLLADRPDEVVQALRFYRESLNRMTLADLRAAVRTSGLELVGLIPWFDRSLVGSLTPDILADVQALYPTATAEDLLATFVAVIVRRPYP